MVDLKRGGGLGAYLPPTILKKKGDEEEEKKIRKTQKEMSPLNVWGRFVTVH